MLLTPYTVLQLISLVDAASEHRFYIMDQEIGTLDRLNLLFTRYPAIDEVGIVPLTEAGTSCVVNDCKLALLKNELRMIYISGRKVMLANNQTKLATADACRALVLINPNNYTAWNNRKKLVTSGDVHVNEDLRLVDLVLGLHPKSAVSWAHRYVQFVCCCFCLFIYSFFLLGFC